MSVFLSALYIGGEGGMSGDVHASAASVLCFSCCFVLCALVWRGGMGGLMTSMRMRIMSCVSLVVLHDVDVALHDVECLCGR